ERNFEDASRVGRLANKHHLVWPRRDADGIGRTDHACQRLAIWRVAIDGAGFRIRRNVYGEHSLEFAFGVEHLDAPVRTIADIDVVIVVDRDRVGQIELARCGALGAPLLHPIPIFVVFSDARIDVAVADIDVAFGIPRDVGRLSEKPVYCGERRLDMFPGFGVFVSRFLSAAEDPDDSAGRVEFDDHVRALVDRPNVVVLVDAHRMGERPAVKTLADLAHENAVLIELEQLRSGGRVSRAARAVGACKHEYVALRVDGYARYFAEIYAVGKLWEISYGIKCEFRHVLLRD